MNERMYVCIWGEGGGGGWGHFSFSPWHFFVDVRGNFGKIRNTSKIT